MSSAMDEPSRNTSSPYDELPECIRQYYSRNDYLWLSDAQKAKLIEQECEPEWT